jgi:hypothetical protein
MTAGLFIHLGSARPLDRCREQQSRACGPVLLLSRNATGITHMTPFEKKDLPWIIAGFAVVLLLIAFVVYF